MKVWPGNPYPLGATWDGAGVNFALFSEHATGVELCLFDSSDTTREAARVQMTERTDLVWHAYLPEARPATRICRRLAPDNSTAIGSTPVRSRKEATASIRTSYS